MVLWSIKSSVIFPKYKPSKHRSLVLHAMTQMCGVRRKSVQKTGMPVLGLWRRSCGLCKLLHFSELESLPLSNVWVGLNGF